MKKLAAILSLVMALNSCSLYDKIIGSKQLAQSEYEYYSIDNISLAGKELGDASDISLSSIAKISTILSSTSNEETLPLNMDLKLKVTNPNRSEASLDALDYNVQINNFQFTEGKIDTPINIEAGKTEIISVPLSIDIKQVMANYSKEEVINLVSAFLGITPNPVEVKLNLTPKFRVGKHYIAALSPIMVKFKFGAKEEKNV